ncbi:MAG: hypothetical protein ABFS24_16620 [Pseudomonadota bacterium]
MYFDNLTLTGLLVTLPYIVMLILFGKEISASRQKETFVLEYTEYESYRYGT